jgi:hypothetical protein
MRAFAALPIKKLDTQQFRKTVIVGKTMTIQTIEALSSEKL